MPPEVEVLRFTSPQGSTVSVSAEKADRLIANGYKPLDEKPKRRTTKADEDK
jgi:hypothetical protein